MSQTTHSQNPLQGNRFNEFGPLRRVALCAPSESYVDQESCDASWEEQLFLGRPDFGSATQEHLAFVEILRSHGAEVDFFEAGHSTGLSAIYARDSSILAPNGMIIGQLANASRRAEAEVIAANYEKMGIPIAGRINGSGLLEGGDFMWFDETTCAVAHGCRTNAEGIRQLKAILGDKIHVEVVGLPYWEGPSICVHLMSFISPLAEDLAVVYPRLMPVPFREFLLERGIKFIEVPDEEYDPSLACNVLAIRPGVCAMIDGNPVTRSRIEQAGCEVIAYPGQEISVKGGGGPTCLTRPILRG